MHSIGQRVSVDQEVARRAVEALRKSLGERLVGVVLFGSRARGDARADSDWDLLVLAEDLPQNTFDRQLFFGRLLLSDIPGAITVVGKTPKEFEAHLPSLYLDTLSTARFSLTRAALRPTVWRH